MIFVVLPESVTPTQQQKRNAPAKAAEAAEAIIPLLEAEEAAAFLLFLISTGRLLFLLFIVAFFSHEKHTPITYLPRSSFFRRRELTSQTSFITVAGRALETTTTIFPSFSFPSPIPDWLQGFSCFFSSFFEGRDSPFALFLVFPLVFSFLLYISLVGEFPRCGEGGALMLFSSPPSDRRRSEDELEVSPLLWCGTFPPTPESRHCFFPFPLSLSSSSLAPRPRDAFTIPLKAAKCALLASLWW